MAGFVRDVFGPSGNYLNLGEPEYGGLGYGFFNSSAGGIVRGGAWNYQAGTGIFATGLNSLEDNFTNFGFRCVYLP